eukprot:gene26636-32188_t
MDLPRNFGPSSKSFLVPNATSLPLENLVPFFLLMFLLCKQNGIVTQMAPASTAVKKDNIISVLFPKMAMSKVISMQSFVSFEKFFSARQSSPSSEELEHMREAFLCMSFLAKCNQVVCAFGMLVMRIFRSGSFQLTYNGERIIGWCMQNGYIKQGQDLGCQTVETPTPDVVSSVVSKLRSGQALPKDINTLKFKNGPDAVHVWLTFVTESGKVYDLDLSAFQFGHMTPFPFIVPVLSAEPTALLGMCDRDTLFGTDPSSFSHFVRDLVETHAKMLQDRQGGKDKFSTDMMLRSYDSLIDLLLLPSNVQFLSSFRITTLEQFFSVLKQARPIK